MRRLLVVGGGVLGAWHARAARAAGWQVVLCERDAVPRKASVRNFGLIWCSGRAPGEELALALDARRRWQEAAREVPGIGFRPLGSLTLARDEAEATVLEEFAVVAPGRGLDVRLCGPEEVAEANPAVRGRVRAGLLCRDDAVVEPRQAAPALLAWLAEQDGVEVRRGVAVRALTERPSGVRAETSATAINADAAVVCPGADHQTLFGAALAAAPLDRCRLQMLETAPLAARLTTALADGWTLRYYPGFAGLPSARGLPPAPPLVAAEGIQLLCVQRPGGGLTIGDSHRYDEPFAFDLDARVEHCLLELARQALGTEAPPVIRRWAGVYSRARDGAVCVRLRPSPGVYLVTGFAGRGMTLAPAVAHQTIKELT